MQCLIWVEPVLMYTCGTSLSNIEDEELLEGIYTRSDITCNMPIELPYYSAKYEDICFYCGTVKHLDVQDASYPICEGCKGLKLKAQKQRTQVFKPRSKNRNIVQKITHRPFLL